MSKPYKVIILIGRFEPFHKGHLANFLQAAEVADKVQILVGSSYQPPTPKNPFRFYERKKMIEESIYEAWPNRHLTPDSNYEILPIRDFKYSNNNWIKQVQTIVYNANPDISDNEIAIMGYDKDDSSWYHHAFPNWEFIPLSGFVQFGSNPIDATKIRELFFEGNLDYIQGTVPPAVFKHLQGYVKYHTSYELLVEEYQCYKEYKKAWAVAPYPPIFHTTDAVVIQGGHILLIQRGFSPGKGLWALPGGFLNPKETLEDGCIRELIEETKIKVPEIVLRKGITYDKVFDHPDRSLRGRTITHAFLIELDGGDGSLPRVKGSDDAKKAKWVSLAEIAKMEEVMFEDHGHIIDTLVARAKK